MSDYEKHIGKLKKVDLSNYNNNTEKFFEEQYRILFTNFSEKKLKIYILGQKIMYIVKIEVFGNIYFLILV